MNELTMMIIVYSINFLLLLPFIIVKTQSKIFQYQFHRTIAYVKNKLGIIIGINGPIRVGKTSLQSGLSSVCQIITIQEISDMMSRTKVIFNHIDFNEFDALAMNILLQFQGLPEFDVLANEFLNHYDLDGNAIHYDMIGQVTTEKLILDYLYALWVMNIRNNFVQSKTPFYSHITGTYNMNLETDWLNIRDAYKNKNYAIHDWMTLLIDELTDEAGAMEYLSDVKDQKGGKEYRRKFGQIHQERNRMITTKQDVMDEVKKYRNLTHSNLVIDEKVQMVANFMWIYNIIAYFMNQKISMILFFRVLPVFLRGRFKALLVNPFRLLLKKPSISWITYDELKEIHRNRIGRFRHIENKLYYMKQFFKSIGYNRYVGFNIKRAEDIERSTAERDEVILYIPTHLCFGTYETHLYRSYQTDLLKRSEVISHEVNSYKDKQHLMTKVDDVSPEGIDDLDF
jgi:hypothetical protein